MNKTPNKDDSYEKMNRVKSYLENMEDGQYESPTAISKKITIHTDTLIKRLQEIRELQRLYKANEELIINEDDTKIEALEELKTWLEALEELKTWQIFFRENKNLEIIIDKNNRCRLIGKKQEEKKEQTIPKRVKGLLKFKR